MSKSMLSQLVQEFPDGYFRVTDTETGEVMAQGNGKTLRELGLSTCHNSRKLDITREDNDKGEFTFYVGGSMIKADKKRYRKINQSKRAKRGKVQGFSNASRRRLQRKLGILDAKRIPVFVTLTYPGDWSKNPKDWKYDLKKFIMRLCYVYPRAAGIWKLEPQKRGAPHFHLMVWGVEYLDLLDFSSLAWYEVVSSGDIRHLEAGVRVETVRSWRGVRSYASKYLGKEVEVMPGWEEVGRYWGVFKKDNLPMAKVEIYEVDRDQVYKAIRMMRRYGKIRSRDYGSLTLLVNDVTKWKEALLK